MNISFKEKFRQLWKQYFKNAELPIAYYFTDEEVPGVKKAVPTQKWNCLICELSKVRNGESLSFNLESLGCTGARRYLGYTDKLRPGFEYFLSCGNEKMEGERYKQSPELVEALLKNQRKMPAHIKNIVFRPWDQLTETDNPEMVVFFAKADVLAGLFTLANYDQEEPDGVFAPFSAGCGSIVYFPYFESISKRPRAVLGMFDISARPYVPADTLSFTIPMIKFEKMVDFMDESFLITNSWKNIMKRLD
ncbi:MAG: DUF169 domain-containing protein [Bacteroidia bacterium]|nr:DUF169 domain-containing protein [Bacteroidia bacterium]